MNTRKYVTVVFIEWQHFIYPHPHFFYTKYAILYLQLKNEIWQCCNTFWIWYWKHIYALCLKKKRLSAFTAMFLAIFVFWLCCANKAVCHNTGRCAIRSPRDVTQSMMRRPVYHSHIVFLLVTYDSSDYTGKLSMSSLSGFSWTLCGRFDTFLNYLAIFPTFCCVCKEY